MHPLSKLIHSKKKKKIQLDLDTLKSKSNNTSNLASHHRTAIGVLVAEEVHVLVPEDAVIHVVASAASLVV